MVEIERKFLVKNDTFKQHARTQYLIAQGYLSSHPERTVRVRIKGDLGYLTIKGKSSASGMSRFEWEKEIPVTDAQKLLLLCEQGIIEKIRYEIPVDNNLFEVDVFFGENKDLIIAEIELPSETTAFMKPDWLDKEVTQDIRYYNAYLSKHPFKNWK